MQGMDHEVYERSKVEGFGSAAVHAEQQIPHRALGIDDEP